MEIKKVYRLNIVVIGTGTGSVAFDFNTISEVKLFLNKHYSGSYYTGLGISVKLYEIVYTWDMANGSFNSTETLVNLDS